MFCANHNIIFSQKFVQCIDSGGKIITMGYGPLRTRNRRNLPLHTYQVFQFASPHWRLFLQHRVSQDIQSCFNNSQHLQHGLQVFLVGG